MEPMLINCRNCGNEFAGSYCNRCGEKVYTEKDKSIKHIFEEALHFITHFDGTFFVTIKTLFTKPGKYSLDYCTGTRRKYFKPVSLFLICVILYLLFPMFDGLNMKLGTYTSEAYNFRWFAKGFVDKKLASEHISFQQLAQKYNEESPKISKILLLLYLPVTALLFNLLSFNKRKPFFDHFILATEFNIFLISFTFLLVPAFLKLTGLIFRLFHQQLTTPESSLELFGIFSQIIFCTFAFHRFYKDKWWLAIIKSSAAVVIYGLLITLIYKMIVLLTVLAFI